MLMLPTCVKGHSCQDGGLCLGCGACNASVAALPPPPPLQQRPPAEAAASASDGLCSRWPPAAGMAAAGCCWTA